jgi:hypothetical protein
MISNFRVDQVATFQHGVIFIASEPKLKFGSVTDQECLKDGTPRWDVHLLVGMKNQFGQLGYDVLKVGVASHKNPSEGLAPQTPVQLVDFEVGVMEKTRKNPETGEEKVIGVNVWYRAKEIRSTAATGPRSTKDHAA